MNIPPRPQSAFSLVELLCLIGVIIVLAALLFPALARSRAYANATHCIHNLTQISIASTGYTADHGNNWPPSQTGKHVFTNALNPYLGPVPGKDSSNFMRSPFICPSAKTDDPDSPYIYSGIYTPSSYTDPVSGKAVIYGLSYAQNVYAPSANVPTKTSVEFPSKMMLYMEFQGHYVATVGTIGDINNEVKRRWLESRHNKKINVAFADGSVRSISYDDIPTQAATSKRFWVGRGN